MPITQAAKALGVSPTTVRRRVADGQLAGQRQPHRGGFRWLVLIPTEADDGNADPPDFETPPQAGPPADRRPAVRDAIAEVRETEESLRELAARVDLASREIIHFVERERTSALRHADHFEDAAREVERAERAAPHLRIIDQAEAPEVESAPPAGETQPAHAEPEHETAASAPDTASAAQPNESGSVLALLLSCAVLVAMIAVSFVALPAWANGIVGSVAVVAGLIAVVELFLVVSGRVATRHDRSMH